MSAPSRLLPIILSGGAGTRLWPVSREAHPKPFIRLADGQSLLQKTFLRAAGLPGVEEVVTVTNRDYYFQTKDEYQATAAKVATTFLLEPCGRNTAPAIALAALFAQANHGPETTLLVLPADHLIRDLDAFAAAVAAAGELAAEGRLVTFGIEPTAPETGFGYIEAGEKVGAGRTALRFVEKPDAARAAEYLAAGNFYWNSGMFCFRADALITAMEAACPEVLAAARVCWSATDAAARPIEFPREAFAAQPDISIDYAVMEKAANVAVVPCKLGWSDIGSWNALCALAQADEAGNRALGEALLIDSRNTFVQSEHHLVAALGVEDLVIVDTPDATLVAHKDKAQDVKAIVQRLKAQGHEAYRLHRTVFRPWGSYTVLEEGPRFKIKRIEVKPGASLSLQMHHHRSEHWIVVRGMAKVVNGEREIYVNTNESTYIPAGHKHRLENPGKLDLVMIEVQCGEYLGEDDIVRAQHGVQTIYHAAAYKHVPLVQANVVEGAVNNVLGTQVLGQAALSAGVETFVLISTDKAVRPSSVMGATKRWAELIVQDLDARARSRGTGQRFCAVRFGNVLGSSGSVIPLFKEQIAQGGPVTVTHPEMTRYFMSIHEAVELVIQAGSLAEGGEVFLLDMGEPVRIVDLARNMIRLAGFAVRDADHPDGDIEITFIGMRAGEKLHEELAVDWEQARPTAHPKIRQVREPALPSDVLHEHLQRLQAAVASRQAEAVRQALWAAVEQGQPALRQVA